MPAAHLEGLVRTLRILWLQGPTLQEWRVWTLGFDLDIWRFCFPLGRDSCQGTETMA